MPGAPERSIRAPRRLPQEGEDRAPRRAPRPSFCLCAVVQVHCGPRGSHHGWRRPHGSRPSHCGDHMGCWPTHRLRPRRGLRPLRGLWPIACGDRIGCVDPMARWHPMACGNPIGCGDPMGCGGMSCWSTGCASRAAAIPQVAAIQSLAATPWLAAIRWPVGVQWLAAIPRLAPIQCVAAADKPDIDAWPNTSIPSVHLTQRWRTVGGGAANQHTGGSDTKDHVPCSVRTASAEETPSWCDAVAPDTDKNGCLLAARIADLRWDPHSAVAFEF